jgi:hypothetical protein
MQGAPFAADGAYQGTEFYRRGRNHFHGIEIAQLGGVRIQHIDSNIMRGDGSVRPTRDYGVNSRRRRHCHRLPPQWSYATSSSFGNYDAIVEMPVGIELKKRNPTVWRIDR